VIVLQFGEPVVHVFEPLPGTSHVVAAAGVAAVTRSASAERRDRRISMELNLAWGR
jgi:hypothetical protein